MSKKTECNFLLEKFGCYPKIAYLCRRDAERHSTNNTLWDNCTLF